MTAFKKPQDFSVKSARMRLAVIRRDPSFAAVTLERFRNWLLEQTTRPTALEWECAYCGQALSVEYISFDHGVPLDAGGASTLDNGRICCEQCNARKGAIGEREWNDLKALVGSWHESMKRHFWQRWNSQPMSGFWRRNRGKKHG